MAKITARFLGLQKTLDAVRGQATIAQEGAMKGLIKGGARIQASSMKKTPVEYGFLRASAFSRKALDGSVAVEVGYHQAYARFVHDNTKMKLRGKKRKSGIGTYWNPGEAQFLLKAYKEQLKAVISDVREAIGAEKKRG